MAMKISQNLKQTQSLMMTPQLQQAIKLLTLTHLEMTNLIATEMAENPLLEEMGEGTAEVDIKDLDYKIEKMEMQNEEATSDNFTGPELIKKDEFDWANYIEGFNSHSSTPRSMATPDPEDNPNYENMVSRGQTLPEHLLWQLRMESLTDDEWKLAETIVHNLDDDGYLDQPFEEILKGTKIDEEDARELLNMIQNLDPIGCGAGGLQECLLIQARALEPRMPLVEKIILHHLDDLYRKDFEKIAKAAAVEKDMVKDAAFIIHTLNPKPGNLIDPEEAHYVIPDIYVKEVGGKFVVQVNDEGVPTLKVSNLYRSLLMQAKQGKLKEDTEEYIQDKLRSALWLIKSIQNRKRTIIKVAEAIVKYQQDFFRKGPSALKPMILKDIANEISMHESTVSRVTTNKYMHTPIGVFELKYFFNSSIGGANGGIDIASEGLKLKIKKMVDSESSRRPLSDQKIADLLKEEGVMVARRTVAKYREMMGILPSSKRKRMA